LEKYPDQNECRVLYGPLYYTAISNSPGPGTRPTSYSNYKAFLPFYMMTNVKQNAKKRHSIIITLVIILKNMGKGKLLRKKLKIIENCSPRGFSLEIIEHSNRNYRFAWKGFL